jgi:UDP-N-acetylglucosamine--N-acetylmuramyl-(pentapeptide) pyrophosphoryl-undecaprenol N-acetylglucosamine transferase
MLFAYKETKDNWKKSFSEQAVHISGNPVRKEIIEGSREKGRAGYNIPKDTKIILILGGSQGALQINNMIHNIINDLIPSYFVIHQMGEYSFKISNRDNYITESLFKENFPHILAAADIIVSRAGAGTLWENGVLGKPSILIPLGSGSSRGDQIRNAVFFENHKAAIVLEGDKLNSQGLLSEINRVLNAKSVLNELEKNVKLLCNNDSVEIIVKIIYAQIGIEK